MHRETSEKTMTPGMIVLVTFISVVTVAAIVASAIMIKRLSQPAETTSQITAETPRETTSPTTTERPRETASPTTTESPRETMSPTTTERPRETTSPTTTEKPRETTSPITTERPRESTSPTTTERPRETASPTTTERPRETASPTTTERPRETASPITTERPRETASPTTTERPRETTQPVEPPAPIETDYPAVGPVPSVPQSHSHSYKTDVILKPGCVFGGYTLEKCGCGATRFSSLTKALGHSLLHAAFAAGSGALSDDSVVMHVTFCERCHEFKQTPEILSDLKVYGIFASSVFDAPEKIRFVSEGKTYVYKYSEPDLSTYTCPDRPSRPQTTAPTDISALPKCQVPSIPKNDRGSYPFSAVMRDGSVINAYWTRATGVLAPVIIKDDFDIAVGDCGWGFSYDTYYNAWVYGIWYHPQINTWYFSVCDIDPRFS